MHSIDRHWPVMFVPVIVVLAMLLVAYIVLYGLTGESPQWMISRIDWLSWNTCLNVYRCYWRNLWMEVYPLRIAGAAARAYQDAGACWRC